MTQSIDGSQQIRGNSVTDTPLAATGVVAGVYGSATKVAQVTVTAKGRVSNVAEVPISAVATTIITPPQITTDQNNYHPTGLAADVVLLLDSDAQWDITGLFVLAEGSVVWMLYLGANAINLVNDSASSSAANRFAFDRDFTLLPNEGIQLQYLNARWHTYTPNLLTVNTQVTVDKDGSLIGAGNTLNFETGDGTALQVSQGSPTDPVVVKIATVIDNVKLTAQTADITPTALVNSAQNGQYRVTYYMVTTTGDGAAGDITLTIANNDGTAARTQSSSSLALTGSAAISGSFIVRVGNATAPTYAISHTGAYGTADYALYVTSEPLGLD